MTHQLPTLNRVYPGMACSSTEFFVSNKEVKIIQNSKITSFSEISFETIKILENEINKNISVKLELHDMHPTSKIKRLEQFAKCRFGGLDFHGDIQDGKLQDGEFWDCPLRGSCKSEGILCKLPTFNEHRLSTLDVQLIQETSTDKKNTAIADDLQLPLGSFHKAKQILYNKLGVQTKQEVVRIGVFLNLIHL